MRSIGALAIFVFSFVPAVAADVNDWTVIHDKALNAAARGDFPTALNLLKKCAELAQTPGQAAASANDLGLVLFRTGQLQEARQSLAKAVEAWSGAKGNFGRMADASVTLARLDRQIGQYAEAERTLRAVLAAAPQPDKLSPSELESKVVALDELGDMMREQSRSEESRTLLVQAAGIPGVSWKTHEDAAVGLAELDRDARNWEESIARWNAIEDVGRAHNDNELQAVATRGLGQTWLERGNPDRAEPLFRSALATFEKDPGLNDRQVASTLTSMGQLYMTENKLALAEDSLTKALQADQRAFGETHPQVAVLHQMLADTLSRRNEMDLARDHLNRAVRILAGTFGEQSPLVGAAMANWGIIEERAHNPARAAGMFEKSLTSLGDSTAPQIEHVRRYVLQHYADVLKATHRKDQADAVLSELKSFDNGNRQSK